MKTSIRSCHQKGQHIILLNHILFLSDILSKVYVEISITRIRWSFFRESTEYMYYLTQVRSRFLDPTRVRWKFIDLSQNIINKTWISS